MCAHLPLSDTSKRKKSQRAERQNENSNQKEVQPTVQSKWHVHTMENFSEAS